MVFARWFRRNPTLTSTGERRDKSFHPSVQALEDRTVPSGFWRHWNPPTSGPATHLQVVTPSNVQSGIPFFVLVKAETASNQLAWGYTGTVHFSLGSTDSGATLPADYIFKARDHGLHFFRVTLSATGAQTISATDTTTSTITGSASTTVAPAPVATHFAVYAPSHITIGVPAYVTVVALDASNHRVPNYTGTVIFSSTDGAATYPANYSFVAADHGKHAIQVIFGTAGAQTFTATDADNSTIKGSTTPTIDAVGAVTHFGVRSFGISKAGTASSVVVVALDANNRVVAGYTGTVHFTSTDASATLPADYAFVAGDYGKHVFSATFVTPGRQTLTATDVNDSTITGTSRVWVVTSLWGRGWHRHY